MYSKHNIHQVLQTFISYSSRFPVTLRISYEQSSWVRGENTSLVEVEVGVGVGVGVEVEVGVGVGVEVR